MRSHSLQNNSKIKQTKKKKIKKNNTNETGKKGIYFNDLISY